MIRALTAVLTLTLAAWATGARAEDTTPTTFTCEFKTGATWSFEAGKFSSKEPAPLSFELDNVDLDAQHAVIRTGTEGQTGNIAIARALGANHFLEVATEGFWNITTIYDKDPATGLYPAVHSRHTGLVGQPVFAQYAGTCAGK